MSSGVTLLSSDSIILGARRTAGKKIIFGDNFQDFLLRGRQAVTLEKEKTEKKGESSP